MSHATETALHGDSHCRNNCYSNLPCISVQGTAGSYSLYLEKVMDMFFLQLIDSPTLTSNKHVLLHIKISGDKIETVTF
jgi:hypothetical protein